MPRLVSSVTIFVINIMGIHWLLLLTSYHLFLPFWRFSDFNPWDVMMWGSAKFFYVKKESAWSKWLGAAGLEPAIQDFLAEEIYIFSSPKSQVGLWALPYLIVHWYRRLILFSGCKSGGAWGSRLLSSVEVRNKLVYTSTPPYAFISYKDMSFAHKLLENDHSTFGLPSTFRCLKVQNMNTTSQKEDLSLCQGKRWHELNRPH
jgi:hypothetical protein